MKIAVILEKNLFQIREAIEKANPFADGFEIRLDSLEKIVITNLKEVLEGFTKPFIFTLRRKDQGGCFSGTEKERLEWIEKLIALKPEYFDLEYDLPSEWIEQLKKNHPKTSLIGSFHQTQFKHSLVRKEFENIYQQLSSKPFDDHKIVTYAKDVIDVFLLMLFMKHQKKNNLSCMCIGKAGELSRMIAKACGSKFVYGYVGESKIEGQLSLEDLNNIYHIPKESDGRKIYALIGNPIDQSIGHLYHNKFFKKKALYVKILLFPKHMRAFFDLMQQLPMIIGFSVTTPFKEKVITLLDGLSSEAEIIGGVNTITLDKNHKWIGNNTDGKGAIAAVEEVVSDINEKSIAIIGTGPTARAIAYEAISRGARVILFSRNPKEARKKISFTGAEIEDINDLSDQDVFDVFIDATGSGIRNVPSAYKTKCIPNCSAYMHLSIPSRATELYKNTKGSWIEGEKMFSHQANLQQVIWSKETS